MSGHRIFLADLEALDEGRATFQWQDGDTVDRVRVELPRTEWEQAGRVSRITVVVADLSEARIDDVDALANAWDDGYKHAVNPHWRTGAVTKCSPSSPSSSGPSSPSPWV